MKRLSYEQLETVDHAMWKLWNEVNKKKIEVISKDMKQHHVDDLSDYIEEIQDIRILIGVIMEEKLYEESED